MSEPVPITKLEPKARERLKAEIRRKFWDEHMTVAQVRSAMWKGGYEVSAWIIRDIVGPIPKSRRGPRWKPPGKKAQR